MIQRGPAPQFINPWRQFHGAMIPNWLLVSPKISPTSKLVYGRLCQFAGKNGVAFPAKQTLAEAVGISRRRVCLCLTELSEHGLICSTERRVPGRPNKSNEYRFLYSRMMGTDVELEGGEGIRGVPLGGLGCTPRGSVAYYIRDSSEVDSHEERETRRKTYRAAPQLDVSLPGGGEELRTTEKNPTEEKTQSNHSAFGFCRGFSSFPPGNRAPAQPPAPGPGGRGLGRGAELEVIDGGLSKTGLPRLFSEEPAEDLGGLDNQSYVGEDPEQMADEETEERMKIARATANFAKLRADKQAIASADAKLERERRREVATGMTKLEERVARREGRLNDPDRPKTATDVEKWFHEGMRDFFPHVTDPRWDVKEKTFAKRLVEAYGAPLVEKAVRSFLVNWGKFQDKHKKADVGPIPTIALLYGWRKAIFAEMELNQEKIAAIATKPMKKFF